MPKVLVLPDHIASQIAAGEVVERPASVVKELVENSIDAGASQIEIAVGADCRDIRGADNGCGMEAEDAVLAFHRHATSKLASADDLWKLRTMGFRGEALPSIASVARVTCYTRTSSAASGTRVEVAEGTVSACETGCAPGTVIEVNDLFYNVPARLKFLKKPSTEFAHVHEVVQALAVAYPKIVFQLLNSGQVVFKTSGSGKLAQAMVESGFASGKEDMCRVTYADLDHGIAVYGYVARPTHFRGDRKAIMSIVNNRPVRCHLTYKALDYAYQDLIPRGRYPIAVLTMTLDPGRVDVNVHPTKKEIKYTNGNDVYLTLQRSVLEAVRRPEEERSEEPVQMPRWLKTTGDYPIIPEPAIGRAGEGTGRVGEGAPAGVGALPAAGQRSSAQQIKLDEQLSYVPPQAVARPPGAASVVPLRPRLAGLPANWRLLGYLTNTYILLETPEGLEIVEQHIAHERTIYERLLAAQSMPGRLSESAQRLVISVPLNLSPEQRSIIQDNLEQMRRVGFDFEFQGEASVLCTQVPLELAHKDYASAVQGIIEGLATTDSAELELEATKSVACQAAIKNGMPLGESEIVQLLAEWVKAPRKDTCPHGRPVRLKFTMEKLFQLFHPG